MEQVYGTMIQQMPNDFDLNKYIQMVEFKKYDLKKRGQNIKITAYEMFRKNCDMREISQATGFSINEILETINETDPLMYISYINGSKENDAIEQSYDYSQIDLGKQFKQHDVDREEIAKSCVIRMCRNGLALDFISQTTGFSINDIWSILEQTDFNFFYFMKQQYGETDKVSNVKVR